MTTFKQKATAIETRLAAALVLAQVVEGSFELIKAKTNRQEWNPEEDPKPYYLRGYDERVGSRRQGISRGVDIVSRMLFVEIGIPHNIPSIIEDVFAAIEPAFLTASDGLEFEEAPDLSPGLKDGTHYVAIASFPFVWARVPAVAA